MNHRNTLSDFQIIKIRIIEVQDRIKKLQDLVDTCVSTRQRDLYEGGILVLEDQLEGYQNDLLNEPKAV